MEKVTAFIPSEVIGAYVALSGLLAPLYKSDEFKWKWVLFFICLGLIPIVMALSYALRRKDGLPTPKLFINLVLLILALVAFIVWVAALPGTPFTVYSPNVTVFGGGAVIVLAILMYPIAKLLDAAPQTQ